MYLSTRWMNMDDVRVLLDAAALAQVGQHRPVGWPLFNRAAQLRHGQHRHVQGRAPWALSERDISLTSCNAVVVADGLRCRRGPTAYSRRPRNQARPRVGGVAPCRGFQRPSGQGYRLCRSAGRKGNPMESTMRACWSSLTMRVLMTCMFTRASAESSRMATCSRPISRLKTPTRAPPAGSVPGQVEGERALCQRWGRAARTIMSDRCRPPRRASRFSEARWDGTAGTIRRGPARGTSTPGKAPEPRG